MEKGRRSLYEPNSNALMEAGCHVQEMKDFEDGGIVIVDSRVCFEMVEGYSIVFEFATADVVEKWDKMSLPKLEVLMRKVADMESVDIGLKFEFEDLPKPELDP
ncbi:uncharacterized protein PG998_014292 [Apiospora kogelbergensis]|uniref:uncharacterized protein n=1 Tax=Apiospora kogelbergensis TaxID=1337665 RepID=UPI00312F24F8